MKEVILTGGSVNRITRKGDVVYREGGPWVRSVHTVLNHLSAKGVSYSPKALGLADDGREMISFLQGQSMYRPWREIMFTDSALQQSAEMLRLVHDATADLIMPEGTVWRNIVSAKLEGQIIRHGDLGPWNTLWVGDKLTGLIDWDFCEPGERATDVAQLASYFVPFLGGNSWQDVGFSNEPDYTARLGLICNAYGGISVEEVIRSLVMLQIQEKQRIVDNAKLDIYPWTKWFDEGEADKIDIEATWIKKHFPDYL